jgi:Sulfatase
MKATTTATTTKPASSTPTTTTVPPSGQQQQRRQHPQRQQQQQESSSSTNSSRHGAGTTIIKFPAFLAILLLFCWAQIFRPPGPALLYSNGGGGLGIPRSSNTSSINSDEEAADVAMERKTSQRSNEKKTNTKNRQTKTNRKKPLNVVILYPDDMRHDSLGCAGTQLVQTPFLDSLAASGIRFTHNCVTSSICWISRATLFTGQYVSRHRSDKLFRPAFYQEWNTTWPHLLQKHRNYYTGHIAKWQFQNRDRFVETHFNWTRLFEGQHWHQYNASSLVHASDLAALSTIEFLRERPKDRPFAVTAAFYPPKGISGKQYFNPKPESLHLYENVSIPEPLGDWNASFYALNQTIFNPKNTARQTWLYSFGNATLYQKNMKDMYRYGRCYVLCIIALSIVFALIVVLPGGGCLFF